VKETLRHFANVYEDGDATPASAVAHETENLSPSTRVFVTTPRWLGLLQSYVRHTLALLEHLDEQCPDCELSPSSRASTAFYYAID